MGRAGKLGLGDDFSGSGMPDAIAAHPSTYNRNLCIDQTETLLPHEETHVMATLNTNLETTSHTAAR